jgi:hypothetical protein
MSDYLNETLPSWYDLEKSWCLTIGRYELECAAHAITEYCQAHGDRWQPVPGDKLSLLGFHDVTELSMKESWLCALQRVRKPMPGPPSVRLSPRSGVPQLVYPNGEIIAAAHRLDHVQVGDLLLFLRDRRLSDAF